MLSNSFVRWLRQYTKHKMFSIAFMGLCSRCKGVWTNKIKQCVLLRFIQYKQTYNYLLLLLHFEFLLCFTISLSYHLCVPATPAVFTCFLAIESDTCHTHKMLAKALLNHKAPIPAIYQIHPKLWLFRNSNSL